MAIGLWGTEHSEKPSTTGNLSASTAKTYTLTAASKKVWVWCHPSVSDYLYVKFNADSATDLTTTDWEGVITGGQMVIAPSGLLVESVTLLCSSALTLGTDFQIRGWA
jgi:hypothetical protein